MPACRELWAQALYAWALWARPDQLEPPGDWRVWLLRSGRGAGKTRTGAEWVRAKVEAGIYRRIALVGRTWADVRDVMVEGESGLLADLAALVLPRLSAQPATACVWPNGAIAKLYSAEEPDLLRGPQHDAAWCDELASWRAPETWDNLMMGLRLGADPRCVVTTTPRPTKLIRSLIAKETTVETQASTYANRANLAAAFFARHRLGLRGHAPGPSGDLRRAARGRPRGALEPRRASMRRVWRGAAQT